MLECLALVAGVCLSQDAQIEIFNSSIMRGAVIRLPMGEIHSIVSSDNLTYGLRPDLFEKCGKLCLAYSQKCGVVASGHVCEIYYTPDIRQPVRRLTVLADTEEKMAQLNASVSLCAGADCHRLSDLKSEPAGEFPPIQR